QHFPDFAVTFSLGSDAVLKIWFGIDAVVNLYLVSVAVAKFFLGSVVGASFFLGFAVYLNFCFVLVLPYYFLTAFAFHESTSNVYSGIHHFLLLMMPFFFLDHVLNVVFVLLDF